LFILEFEIESNDFDVIVIVLKQLVASGPLKIIRIIRAIVNI